MYYLIETRLLSANADRNLNNHRVEIRTQPARTNMSNEIMINGWCGTSNDLNVAAHGEYDCIEAARENMGELFGPTRQDRDYEPDGFDEEEGLIERYLVGEYDETSHEQTIDYLEYGYSSLLTGLETDGQIFELSAEAETFANQEGFSIPEADSILTEARDEARKKFYGDHEDEFCDPYPSAYAKHRKLPGRYWVARAMIDGDTYEVIFHCLDTEDQDPDTYDWAECIVDINHI